MKLKTKSKINFFEIAKDHIWISLCVHRSSPKSKRARIERTNEDDSLNGSDTANTNH